MQTTNENKVYRRKLWK